MKFEMKFEKPEEMNEEEYRLWKFLGHLSGGIKDHEPIFSCYSLLKIIKKEQEAKKGPEIRTFSSEFSEIPSPYRMIKLMKGLEQKGFVEKSYVGGQDEDGYVHCYHGWALTKKSRHSPEIRWIDELEEAYDLNAFFPEQTLWICRGEESCNFWIYARIQNMEGKYHDTIPEKIKLERYLKTGQLRLKDSVLTKAQFFEYYRPATKSERELFAVKTGGKHYDECGNCG